MIGTATILFLRTIVPLATLVLFTMMMVFLEKRRGLLVMYALLLGSASWVDIGAIRTPPFGSVMACGWLGLFETLGLLFFRGGPELVLDSLLLLEVEILTINFLPVSESL